MSDYYYEINDAFLNINNNIKGKYIHRVLGGELDGPEKNPDWIYNIDLLSDRIWREYDNKVYWFKNRTDYDKRYTELDQTELKEFVWIKLSAING